MELELLFYQLFQQSKRICVADEFPSEHLCELHRCTCNWLREGCERLHKALACDHLRKGSSYERQDLQTLRRKPTVWFRWQCLALPQPACSARSWTTMQEQKGSSAPRFQTLPLPLKTCPVQTAPVQGCCKTRHYSLRAGSGLPRLVRCSEGSSMAKRQETTMQGSSGRCRRTTLLLL